MLLKAGARINLETTLSDAAHYGDLQIVTILLEIGSKVNGPDMRELKRALQAWEHEIESKLIEVHKSSNSTLFLGEDGRARERIEKKMWGNVTVESPMYASRVHEGKLEPPIIAAARRGHPEIVSLLLETGADPDILRVDPGTGDPLTYALGEAAREGHLDVIRVLLDQGASVDGPAQHKVLRNSGKPYNFVGPSFSQYNTGAPLVESVYRNNTAAVELLLESGAKPFPTLWQEGRKLYFEEDYPSDRGSLLHIAAAYGNPDILRLLLHNGYLVDGRYNGEFYQGSECLSACSYRHYGKFLTPREDGDTALSFAVTPRSYESSNAPETVKFLLDSGASVNASNPLGWTALHFAAQSPNKTTDSELEVLRILLEAGIDTDAEGKAVSNVWHQKNVTAIQIALIEGHSDKVKVLLEGNASVDEKDLFLAIPKYGIGVGSRWSDRVYERAESVQHLVAAGLVGSAKNEYGETPLMFTAIKGFVRSSRFLMAADGVDLEEMDAQNRTALALARDSAKYTDNQQVNKPWWEHYNAHHGGQCVVIEDLLARGAQDEPFDQAHICSTLRENLPHCPYSQHCDEWNPTRAAVYYGCIQQVEDISAFFPTVRTRTTQLKEAIHTCLDKSDSSEVLELNFNDMEKTDGSLKLNSDEKRDLKEILDNCLFKVNNMTQAEVKGLLSVRREGGQEAELTNALDIYSTFYSPLGNLLYAASHRGHSALVKILADPSLDMLEAPHVFTGETPLFAAVKNCQVEAVKMLVAVGANLRHRVQGVSVFHLAVKGCDCDYCPQKPLQMLEALFGKNPSQEILEIKDKSLSTPLIWAARYDKNDILKLLIALGANVNYSEAGEGISEGAYNDGPLDEGFRNQTALHWAARNINAEASTLLLAAGADPRIKDSGNRWGVPPRTPLDWAESREYKNIIKIFKDAEM